MDIKLPDYYLKNVNIALKKTINNIVENGNGERFEKGAIITPAKLNKFKDLYLHYMNFFANYPDYFIKLITPSNIKFKLFAYQVYFLRLCLRLHPYYFPSARFYNFFEVTMFVKSPAVTLGDIYCQLHPRLCRDDSRARSSGARADGAAYQ